MAIPEGYRQNFQTLLDAVGNNQAALVECKDAATGKPVMVICALSFSEDGSVTMSPFAKMFDGNPYEELLPPTDEATHEHVETLVYP